MKEKAMDMTLEQTVLLSLMGAAIRGENAPAVSEETDWTALFREACAQAVPLLFFDMISGLPQVPESVSSRSFEIARRCTAHNLAAEHTQNQLTKLLRAGNHPYVILKGEASAAYYPKPELRALGDVDFLLREGHAEAVIEQMKQRGFSHSCEQEAYHQTLTRGSEHLELHFEVAGIPQGDAGKTVRDYLSSVFSESQSREREGGSYRVPCDAHHGMILLLHMQHHMQSHGMGLRQLMDWACFVQRTAGEPFWQERLLPALARIGLRRYCAVMTRLCSLFLGTVCPAWADNVQESLCRELMEDLMAGGNFGRKDKDRTRSTNMLPDWTEENVPKSKLVLLWQTLRRSVLKAHPKLEKRPVMRTLCMLGKAVRYCVLFCAGKRPNLLKAAACADTRRSVYDRLNMFEPEN